jgi:threonine/homoserine/homoserine lactone efflux protein
MTIGIVVGDHVFIILAIFGLSALSETMGTAFIIIKYLSVAYLLWLGYSLLRSKASSIELKAAKDSSVLESFMTGLLITLGNPKAILFYIGFFPAFINMDDVVASDIILIMLTATLAFGSVNICYALLATKAKEVFKSPNATSIINKTAGTIMVTTGIIIANRG